LKLVVPNGCRFPVGKAECENRNKRREKTIEKWNNFWGLHS
jgi:hypothetical protein